MSGLPGTSGFVGEFLTLIGTFKVNIPVATLATLGVILSAAYALWLYRKVIFGKLEKPKLLDIQDLGWREIVDPGAAGVLHDPVRRLSEARARHVAGLGRRRWSSNINRRSAARRPPLLPQTRAQ